MTYLLGLAATTKAASEPSSSSSHIRRVLKPHHNNGGGSGSAASSSSGTGSSSGGSNSAASSGGGGSDGSGGGPDPGKLSAIIYDTHWEIPLASLAALALVGTVLYLFLARRKTREPKITKESLIVSDTNRFDCPSSEEAANARSSQAVLSKPKHFLMPNESELSGPKHYVVSIESMESIDSQLAAQIRKDRRGNWIPVTGGGGVIPLRKEIPVTGGGGGVIPLRRDNSAFEVDGPFPYLDTKPCQHGGEYHAVNRANGKATIINSCV